MNCEICGKEMELNTVRFMGQPSMYDVVYHCDNPKCGKEVAKQVGARMDCHWEQNETIATIFDPDGRVLLHFRVKTKDTYFVEKICGCLRHAYKRGQEEADCLYQKKTDDQEAE